MSRPNVSRMSRTLICLVVILAGSYLALCAALLVFQRALIYFPQPATLDTPRLTLDVADAQVQVSFRPHEGPKALIYFGGNAEDVSRNLPEFAEAFPDHALYLMHYRGFGGSSGSPSEEAIARDALTLFDKVYDSHGEVAVIGRSLGSGVAVRLASQRPATRLVLITPYDSLERLAVRQYPIFPVKWLLKDRFDAWKYAAHVSIPTLLLAAEQDDIIPRASTDALYRHFPKGVAVLKEIAGVGHNSISDSPEYLKLIADGL
ncbi:alpha/beta hydrolase [Pseudomonas sp. PDM04]|uniref:alpha/beta hydrolase n=1 Tax=Pseudomonas sp. PDM04 TaxID=2769296 RepID=UPI001782ED39|nr:alpha/beta fold hydrolase [Pseudomonas sp. PDM04]MBD9439925.1 alpha/beta hydrolase [Pseudomonas sp. PDM04]